MRICMETMSQVLLLGICCLILTEIIMVNVYIQEGRNFLHNSVDRIECSEDYKKTAGTCAKEALKKGYTLTWEELKPDADQNSLLLTLSYNVTLGDNQIYKGAVQAYVR